MHKEKNVCTIIKDWLSLICHTKMKVTCLLDVNANGSLVMCRGGVVKKNHNVLFDGLKHYKDICG